MANFSLTEEAESDLKNIARFTQKDGVGISGTII